MENTYGEGDYVRVVDTEQEREPVTDAEQEEPVLHSEQRGSMVDDTEAKQFGEALLKSVQDLARQIEVMGQRFTAVEARQRETPWVFQVGEGSGTSHHLPEHGAAQRDTPQPMNSRAPTHSTMPTFLGADTEAGAQREAKPGHLDEYFAEYHSYGQEFRDALTF